MEKRLERWRKKESQRRQTVKQSVRQTESRTWLAPGGKRATLPSLLVKSWGNPNTTDGSLRLFCQKGWKQTVTERLGGQEKGRVTESRGALLSHPGGGGGAYMAERRSLTQLLHTRTHVRVHFDLTSFVVCTLIEWKTFASLLCKFNTFYSFH